jgi:hypothetical protein
MGGLLSVPQPIPEDKDSEAPTEPAQVRLADVPEVVAGRIASAPTAPPELRQGSGRKSAPGTLRLNEVARPALWEAFTEAKAADPFLSYRKFASDIVLAGLDTERRRNRR